MKTLGLLGGLTYESTSLYYNLINQHVRQVVSLRSSAELFMYSANQEQMLQLAASGDWDGFADVYVHAAHALIAGGAQAIVICALLAHKVADRIEAQINVPLLHLSDFVGSEVKSRGFAKVAILGTKVAMEGEFVKDRILQKYGVEVLIPDVEDREKVNTGIFNELTTGKVRPETKEMFLSVTRKLLDQGAEGLILGSTDLGFVIREEDIGVPIFDTAKIHALGVAKWALQEGKEE
jgi:aspartate racemase